MCSVESIQLERCVMLDKEYIGSNSKNMEVFSEHHMLSNIRRVEEITPFTQLLFK